MCPRMGAGWLEIHEFWVVLHLGFFQTQWLSLTFVCIGLCDRQSVGYQGERCSGILVLQRGMAGVLHGSPCLTVRLSAAAEPEAEERYRSSVRAASLCRGSLRTPRPEEGGAAGGWQGAARGSRCGEEGAGVPQAAPECSAPGRCPGLSLSTNGGKRWRSARSGPQVFVWKSLLSGTAETSTSNKKPLGLSLNVVSSPFHCSEVNCEGQQPVGFSVTKKYILFILI